MIASPPQLRSPVEITYFTGENGQVRLTAEGLTVGHAFYPFDQIASATRRRTPYARRTLAWWLGLGLAYLGPAVSALLLYILGGARPALAIWPGAAVSALGFYVWWRQASFAVRVTGTFGSVETLRSP